MIFVSCESRLWAWEGCVFGASLSWFRKKVNSEVKACAAHCAGAMQQKGSTVCRRFIGAVSRCTRGRLGAKESGGMDPCMFLDYWYHTPLEENFWGVVVSLGGFLVFTV